MLYINKIGKKVYYMFVLFLIAVLLVGVGYYIYRLNTVDLNVFAKENLNQNSQLSLKDNKLQFTHKGSLYTLDNKFYDLGDISKDLYAMDILYTKTDKFNYLSAAFVNNKISVIILDNSDNKIYNYHNNIDKSKLITQNNVYSKLGSYAKGRISQSIIFDSLINNTYSKDSYLDFLKSTNFDITKLNDLTSFNKDLKNNDKSDNMNTIIKYIPNILLKTPGLYKYSNEKFGFTVHTYFDIYNKNQFYSYINFYTVSSKTTISQTKYQETTIKSVLNSIFKINNNDISVYKNMNDNFSISNLNITQSVKNKTEKNIGDTGYDKEKDNGLYIRYISASNNLSNDIVAEVELATSKYDQHKLYGNYKREVTINIPTKLNSETFVDAKTIYSSFKDFKDAILTTKISFDFNYNHILKDYKNLKIDYLIQNEVIIKTDVVSK